MLLVAFGLPGAGKTYAARVIADQLGLYFHDGDDDLTDDMRTAITASQPISDALRDEFFARILGSIRRLRAEHPDLIVAQTFIKEKYRRLVLERYPEARFILVEADSAVREWRLAHRATGSRLDPEYARRMVALFEPPQIPHIVLSNNASGESAIREQVAEIIAKEKGGFFSPPRQM